LRPCLKLTAPKKDKRKKEAKQLRISEEKNGFNTVYNTVFNIV
jgi:hypothetical protein